MLADETRVISNREHVAITLQWVSQSYDIYENFFGLVQVDANTAECHHSSLKHSLISLGIPFGKGYDGARNFQGCITGVAKRFEMKINQQYQYIALHNE